MRSSTNGLGTSSSRARKNARMVAGRKRRLLPKSVPRTVPLPGRKRKSLGTRISFPSTSEAEDARLHILRQDRDASRKANPNCHRELEGKKTGRVQTRRGRTRARPKPVPLHDGRLRCGIPRRKNTPELAGHPETGPMVRAIDEHPESLKQPSVPRGTEAHRGQIPRLPLRHGESRTDERRENPHPADMEGTSRGGAAAVRRIQTDSVQQEILHAIEGHEKEGRELPPHEYGWTS